MPLTTRGFARALDRLGPFEPAPHLAVAVSGGADSMALALLADRWARDRGGKITAVTVDHGLREDARAEALFARRTLREAGIRHVLLTWRGGKPATGIQAAARTARYRLLEGWCRDNAVLHLLVAHHRGDQAETVAMRRAMQSGPDGLAGMAAIAYRRHVRLLRPLLDVSPEALREVLRRAGVGWIEDPSNRDEKYGRVRVRNAMTPAGRDRLAAAATRAGVARARRDAACALLLARAAVVYSGGYGRLDRALFTAPEALSQRALARMIACVGGRDHAPKRAALARAHAVLRAGRTATLGGCRLIADGEGVLVARELRGIASQAILHPGEETLWDGRFRIAVSRQGTQVHIAAAGPRGSASNPPCIPAAAAQAQPAILERRMGKKTTMQLTGRSAPKTASFPHVRTIFAPHQPLFTGPFPVV